MEQQAPEKNTKISAYRSVILTTLLYRSESWDTYRSHIKILKRFNHRYLGTMLIIHYNDVITNVDDFKQAGITSTKDMLLKSRLRWTGYVSRMEDYRLPKIVMYGELATGHRHVETPETRFKDGLKKFLGASHISITSCLHLPQSAAHGG